MLPNKDKLIGSLTHTHTLTIVCCSARDGTKMGNTKAAIFRCLALLGQKKSPLFMDIQKSPLLLDVLGVKGVVALVLGYCANPRSST